VRVFSKSPSKGISRVSWDLRYQSTQPVEAGEKFDPMKDHGSGLLAMPGKYSVDLTMTAAGETKHLAGPVAFNAIALNNTTLPATDRQAMVAFQAKVDELTRVMRGTEDYARLLSKRVSDILQSLNTSPGASAELKKQVLALQLQLDEILNGKFNRVSKKPSSEENPPAPVPLNWRLEKIAYASFSSTGQPTQMELDAYKILEDEFPPVYNKIKHIGEVDLPELQKQMDNLKAPAVPGYLPEYK